MQHPGQVEAFLLASSSSELNPGEFVWDYLKHHHMDRM